VPVGVPEVDDVGLTVEDVGGVVVVPELVTSIVVLVTTEMDEELLASVVETAVDVELVVTGPEAQPTIVLVSRVTAALSAINEPVLVTPVVTVMAVLARITPLKVVPVPKVAELPIRQKTLHA
jgi:uncharacterized protein